MITKEMLEQQHEEILKNITETERNLIYLKGMEDLLSKQLEIFKSTDIKDKKLNEIEDAKEISHPQ